MVTESDLDSVFLTPFLIIAVNLVWLERETGSHVRDQLVAVLVARATASDSRRNSTLPMVLRTPAIKSFQASKHRS